MSQRKRPAASALLHRIDDITSTSAATVVATVLVAGFLLLIAYFGSGSPWASWFWTIAAAVTLVMVFLIQHTQTRQQIVTQLKLDELIRAVPKADDHLVHIEVGSDHELHEREQQQIDHHLAVRDDGDTSPQ